MYSLIIEIFISEYNQMIINVRRLVRRSLQVAILSDSVHPNIVVDGQEVTLNPRTMTSIKVSLTKVNKQKIKQVTKKNKNK